VDGGAPRKDYPRGPTRLSHFWVHAYYRSVWFGGGRLGAAKGLFVMATILWILAVILVVSGIFAIVRKQLLWGIVLIVVGLLVGPGGVSIFH
jgi:hypothetical protein